MRLVDFEKVVEEIREKLVMLSLVRDVSIKLKNDSKSNNSIYIYLDGIICISVSQSGTFHTIKNHRYYSGSQLTATSKNRVMIYLEDWIEDLLNER